MGGQTGGQVDSWMGRWMDRSTGGWLVHGQCGWEEHRLAQVKGRRGRQKGLEEGSFRDETLKLRMHKHLEIETRP